MDLVSKDKDGGAEPVGGGSGGGYSEPAIWGTVQLEPLPGTRGLPGLPPTP